MQYNFIYGVLQVLPNVTNTIFCIAGLLCSSPLFKQFAHLCTVHTCIRPIICFKEKERQTASAQAALKLQWHDLLVKTVLLQTSTLFVLCYCQVVILVYLIPFS